MTAPLTPKKTLTLGELELELVGSLFAFQLFKATTKELDLGGLDKWGRPIGLSILRGDLDAMDEVSIPLFLWALAHGGDRADKFDPDSSPTQAEIDEALQAPTRIIEALEAIDEIVSEALPDEKKDEEGDSDRNQDEEEDDVENEDPPTPEERTT